MADSSSSSSSSSSEQVEVKGLLGRVQNLTLQRRKAQEEVDSQEAELEEAEDHLAAKIREILERAQKNQTLRNRVQDAREKEQKAKEKPRAKDLPLVKGAPQAFELGEMVKIKATYWNDLRMPACARTVSCHWKVSYYSGFNYTLLLSHAGDVLSGVPPHAIEALDFPLSVGSSVCVSEPPALPAAVLSQLQDLWTRRPATHAGRVTQRKSDSACEVDFGSNHQFCIPNANLRPVGQPVPPAERHTPAEPSAVEGSMLGYTYLDYVRTADGLKGVVADRCPDDAANLKVRIIAHNVEISVPASTLVAEEVWASRELQRRLRQLQRAQEAEKRVRQEEREAGAKVRQLKAQQANGNLVKKLEEAKLAVSEAEKGLVRDCLVVTSVRFKGPERPKELREIASYVTLSWALALLDKSEDPEMQPPTEFQQVARQVVAETDQEPQLFSSDIGHFQLTKTQAQKILKCGDAPDLHSIALLKVAFGKPEDVWLDQEVQDCFDGPMGLIHPKDVAPPENLAEILRPYQVTGFRWLVNNAQNGLGCLLADDMGLGKTLQTISLLLRLKEKHLLKPMLIVVPTGLLQTWRRELEHWAKGKLEVHVFFGPGRRLPAMSERQPAVKRRRLRLEQPAMEGPDIILTSYGVVRSDAQKLALPIFGGMILDEAQSIKNFNTQLRKAVKEVVAVVGPVRVALSGTPVENTVTDLYSIFDFLLPGYLASSRHDFEKTFSQPLRAAARRTLRNSGHAHDPEECKELLNRLTEPFILRRLKTDPKIAADLPPKIEQVHECEMSNKQRTIYESVQALQWAAFHQVGRGRGFQVLEMLHALRAVTNHPGTLKEARRPAGYKPPAVTEIEVSGKCAKLHELLDGIMPSREKVLIFCPSLSALEALLQQIQQRKDRPKVAKITGAIPQPQREAIIKQFQHEASLSILLLSQVGNTGINLTAANHVIHFDRQYNPAKENQATDRAHRIGQKKTVHVHYLLTKDTFEEKLAKTLEEKRQLFDFVMFDCEKFITEMDDAELQQFFQLGCAQIAEGSEGSEG